MAVNKNTLDGIIAGLGAMPKKSEIDTPTNNIDLLATETSEGLMSAEDKVKLNHVETGANNYVLPSAGKDSLGGVKTTSDVNSTKGYTPTPIIDGVPYYKDTLYTLPIATSNTLGGVKIGKNISISEDGAISVSDVSADQMTGIVPINKGGTGASNIHQARINLKTSCFVIVGNTTENDETNSGYYQAFSVPTIASVQYTLRLLISPVTPSYDFEEFTVDIKLNTSASEKLTPVGYMSTVEEQYDVINKLYVAYNASITTGGFYFWYKNTSAKSAIRISVLSCTYSNDITQDGLQTISLNTSGACTSQDTISTSTPNVVLFSDIITTKLATSSMAGYMSKEDKAKLDALDSTLTEQAGQLTSLVNNAYNTIGSPSTTTTTSTDSSDIPYNETKTTVKYEFSKPNGGKSTVSSTDTVIKYKNASSSNAGLLSSADYDYIHSLPDVLSALEETVTNDITTTLDAHVTDTNNPHSVTKAQIGLGNVENKTSATIRNEITKANVTTALGYTPVTPTEFTTHIDEFDAHVANVSNPHSVTKTQIGLGNVENKTSEDIRGEITSTNVTDALTYTPAKATDLTSHISNVSNPHSVTKAQIGLGNVENKTSEDIRGELTATNVTTALGYTPVTPTDLSDHTSDTNNPHSVTKAQIGLGNVENKSSATIRGELTKANVTTALGYTPPSSVTFTQSLTSGTKVGTLNISGTDVDLYAPTNTDTHWTTKLVIGASDTASANAAASNGSVYLNIFDNSTLRNAHKISGTNGVSVTSDSSGNITITGTTYSSVKNPYALELQFNGTTQVSYDGSSAKTLNITPASIGASADNHTHEYLPLSGGTLTGQLIVLGLEASKPIVVRGIAGSDGNGNVGDLYLQHSANSKIFLGNAGGYTISADGSQYSGNSASATKLTTSAGSATQPVYFSGGKPVVTTYTLEKSVPSDAVFTDTVYSHPEYTEQTSGLYKITVDELGHVSAVSSVVKADITALGIPASDTNTHYTSKNVVGSSTDTANTTTALTNGNVYINSVENGAVTSAHKISGSGMSTVTTDTSGNIIVTATHPTSAGNKHIPSGGANGDTLMYSASGTAVWHNDYVVGTQTSSTNAFTGTLSGVSALYDGLSIRYYLPYAGTTSAATLKLTLSASDTTTAAIPIYRNNGSVFTNQCGAGSILYLTYRTATNRWTMSAQYDYDTYDRLRHGGYIKCNTDTAIVPDDIIVAKNGVYYPLKTGTAFDITQPILYSRVNIAVNAISDWTYYSIPAYVTTTQSITLTAYKPLFIKGTLSGNIFTPISATPLTQTIPTSDDGYQYILLGSAYDSTHFHMMPEHPIFEYKNEKFRLVGTRDDATTSTSGYMSASDKVKLNDIDPHATNIPFIVGTQTAATGAWTGTTSKMSSLVDGQTIRYWLPYDGSGDATLNLTLADGNTTGAIACYWKGTSRLATHYAAGTVITLTYRKSVAIGGNGSYTGWWADADFDYNRDTYDRTKYSQAIKCDTTAITAGNIIVGTGGVFKHLKAGTAFDVTYPILYAASDINASATGTNNYIIIPFAVTTTQSITLTAYKPVFIKGSLSGTTFTPISTAPLTQTVPTSADDYEYILLGVTYNTTDMYLLPDHPIFAFKGGAFGQISSKGITDLSVSGQTVTYTRGDGTTGTITTQDKNVTSTLATTTKAYITGTTSATTNTGTLVFDTDVYLDTTTGVLHAKDFKENGAYLSKKYKANMQGVVGQGSPVGDPWFRFAYMTLANYKNYDHNTTFKVYRGYNDQSTALGILTVHIRTSADGKFSYGELVWEYAGEGITLSDFKLAYSPDTNPLKLELWIKITQNWVWYHFDYLTAGNRTEPFNGTGWKLAYGGNGSASITEGYTTIDSTLLKLKNPIADNQYLPITGGLMTGNIGFHGSTCDREIIKFIDNTNDSTGQGIAIGGGGLTIIGGGESAYVARDKYTSGDAEQMLICNDWVIDFYSNCQNGMDSAKHYTMASGVITSESFNATSSYKINDKVAIKYNSTEECVNFVFS